MAQAVNHRPINAESRVRARVSACGIYGGRSGTGQVFLPLTIIPPFLHTHLSPPHEVCDVPDQAA
jgi:hypothetical protein